MSKDTNGSTPEPAPKVDYSNVVASVSFDMSLNQLQKLVDLCGSNNEFHLGIMLAERKSRLKANAARMAKDAALIAAAE